VGDSCKGRVALVTGGSRGIGRALTTRLVAEGAEVAVVARSFAGKELEPGVLTIACDLAVPDLASREAIVTQVEDAFGPVDILVNNAALGGYKFFGEFTDDELRDVQEVNVWAPWQLARRVLPGMRERDEGWVLNVSSGAAELPSGPPFKLMVGLRGTIYGGTKAMLNRWTSSLAAELHETGVAVNAISPQAATATEGVLEMIEAGAIKPEATEPLDTMVEAALALVTCDSRQISGRIAYSLELLADLGRPVFDLAGGALVEGWQPEEIAARFASGQFVRW
jgi:NAD(P)-dependent dehydrogenase (short-subunit alcohol dehydrogenase family)